MCSNFVGKCAGDLHKKLDVRCTVDRGLHFGSVQSCLCKRFCIVVQKLNKKFQKVLCLPDVQMEDVSSNDIERCRSSLGFSDSFVSFVFHFAWLLVLIQFTHCATNCL